jgi:cytidylate kinase
MTRALLLLELIGQQSRNLKAGLVFEMANLIITIDGPAASGKSTVARLVAQRLGASFLDTGAMYRAATLAAMRASVDMNDEKKLLNVLDNTKFQFAAEEGKMAVRIDGVDVTGQIRRPEVTANARYIALAAKLRAKLVQMQRQFAAGEEKIITEGRDQGTVAFPNADIKFFLIADVAERAGRRQAQLRAEGDAESLDNPLEKTQKAIEERDKSDESRKIGPLKPAGDAIIVDTTGLAIEEVLEKLLDCIERQGSQKSA